MDYNSMKAKQVNSEYKNISISRNTQRKAKKAAKKIKANWFIVAFVFIIAVAGGFFAHKYTFKNDVYEMISVNGTTDIVLGGMENNAVTEYEEYGVKCIAFGKDYSKECTVKYYYRNDLTQEEVEVEIEDITTTAPGIYYAVYECPAKKYATVKLIRNIIVLGGEDNG